MKKIKIVVLIISLSLLLLLLVGCEYNTEITNDHVVNNGGAYKEDVEVNSVEITDDNVSFVTDEIPAPDLNKELVEPKTTKIMSIFNIVIETENLDEDIKSLEESIHGLKGYVRSHKVNESIDKKYIKSADVIVRIPKDKASKFIEYVKANFNAIAESSQTVDVTDAFFDLDLAIESLDKQEEQLLLMYERTNSIDDMLKISDRLAEISKEKKKLTISYTNIKERMNYTTIEIVFNEVYELSQSNLSLNERIAKSTSRTFKTARIWIDNAVMFIINNFILIAIIIIILIVYWKTKHKDKLAEFAISKRPTSEYTKLNSTNKSNTNKKHKK